MKRAFVTAVPFGSLTIEGLMDDDKNFYVAVSQTVSQLKLTTQNNATREVKRLLGQTLGLLKLKTDIHASPVNAITLLDFERLIRKAERSGNEQAQLIVDALVGLSLTQIFSDAFGIHFEVEERQEW